MRRETQTNNRLLAVLVGISMLFLSLPLSRPVSSVKACLTYIFDPLFYQGDSGVRLLSRVPQNARNLISAEMENTVLKEKLKNELILNMETDSLKSENARLRSEMGLSSPGARPFVWASVLKRSPADWYQSVIVSAGKNQGLKPNDPVFAAYKNSLAAVGRLVEVRPEVSVVELLTNDISAVAALLVSSGTAGTSFFNGLAQGEGLPDLKINYLPLNSSIREGDLVLTSPASASFPPSVVIGTVIKAEPVNPFFIFKSAEVLPALSPASFNEVLIIKNKKEIKALQ